MLECCSKTESFDSRIKHNTDNFLSEGYLAENTLSIQRLSIELYRMLSCGAPVTVSDLSERLNKVIRDTENLLSKFPLSAIQYNNDGAITAFIGLSLTQTPHKFLVENNILYTWCVFDGLFLPEILDKAANIITQCPVTNKVITLYLHSDQLISYEPKDAVMSFIVPDTKDCQTNIRDTFCKYISFFHSPKAFKLWSKDKKSMEMLTLEDAYFLACQQNKSRYKNIHM